MELSVITPVYYGNKYLNRYMERMSQCAKYMNEIEVQMEVVLVNDSPDVPIVYDETKVKGFDVIVVNNSENSGIHASRVRGVNSCHGRYIVFLDQDDELSKKSLRSQYETIEKDISDVVMANGILEADGKDNLIFSNKFSQWIASKKFAYVWLRDFIVSPGQCIIRKSSIPRDWKFRILENNGTDDYLLWLLMFENEITMTCNYEVVYKHVDTGENLSSNDDKMFESTKELLKVLDECKWFDKKTLKLIKRRIYYKRVDRSNKKLFIKESIKNIDILFVNVIYRIIWRGYLVK